MNTSTTPRSASRYLSAAQVGEKNNMTACEIKNSSYLCNAKIFMVPPCRRVTVKGSDIFGHFFMPLHKQLRLSYPFSYPLFGGWYYEGFRERDMAAVFLPKCENLHSMNQNKQSGRVASEKVRGILSELADTICDSQDKVILSLKGNTFEIHLEGGTINISFNMEGGAA